MNRRVFVASGSAGLLLSASGRLAALARQRTVLEDMGTWLAAMRFEDMPAATVRKARYLLLDTLGCAIGAVTGKPVAVAHEVIRARGGNPQATVIGTTWKVPCDEAAFLNAMQIRYLDFNDYAAFGYPHHPSINLAAALAIGEMRKLSGKDLLLGLAAGYEVHLKIRDASERRGFDVPSIEAQYASAACAARLLGMDANGIANALAIAGSNANTLREVRAGGELTNAKGTAEALAARNGTFAALLGHGGVEYPLTMMEGEYGYGKHVSRGLKEEILRKRSAEFEIMKSCMKMWPSIGTSQAPIAAALQLRAAGLKAGDIASVTLHLSDFGYEQQLDFLNHEINTREHADHSVPYLLARAFIDGDVRISDFEEHRYRDPQALAFIGKVKVLMDPALTTSGGDVLGCRMEVRLSSGAVQKVDMPYAPGSYQTPPTDEQVQHKFLNLTEELLGQSAARRAIDVILSVDRLPDLQPLLAALAPAAASARRAR
jgi:2-methylcitrate dehydratase